MKGILTKSVVFQFIEEQNKKKPDTSTIPGLANQIGRMEVLSELLVLIDNYL